MTYAIIIGQVNGFTRAFKKGQQMKKLSLLILLVLACGCTKHARVYVVEGPLVKENVGIITAKFVDYGTGSGPVDMIFPDGEICKGEYSTLDAGSTSFGTGFGSASASGGGTFGGRLTTFGANAWTTHWGMAANAPNTNWGAATLIGNKGTVIQVEYFARSGSKGCGLAKDNKGNLYKVHF